MEKQKIKGDDIKMDNEMVLKQKAENLVMAAREIIINSQDDLATANDFLLATRKGKKGVTAFFAEMRESAHKAWKTICNKEKRISDIFDQADAIASKKIVEYRSEEKRKALEEQRKAERERLEREQKEKERLLKMAEKAEKKGNSDKAEMLINQAVEVFEPPVIVEAATKKTEISTLGSVTAVADWEIEIIEPAKVIKAVSLGLLPETILKIEESKIKGWARTMGIENYNDFGLKITKTERLTGKITKQGE